ncbi:MAG: CRISPR system precrRNA processing endoribonuclease RAMP protein Cas6 [Acidobacteria bacterium]|nr:CRISPR system precrRNA processing endoribonuclease RAMP protein Cas6 [Acidobacteriota bacterium]
MFEFAAYRFEFRALDEIRFPPGKSGNVFRGALGETLRREVCRPDCPGAGSCPHRAECAYARLFEPVLEGGPSGLASPPRPFVLRPKFEEGRPLAPGETLRLDLHLFDVRTPFLPHLIGALSQLARTGLGPGRGRAELDRVFTVDEQGRPAKTIRISLAPSSSPVSRIRVHFETPTELKAGGQVAEGLDFPVLAMRLRDRVSALNRLYGDGSVQLDWKGLAEQAAAVRTAASALRREEIERRSSRTGQTHPLGGLLGWVEYEGRLEPFLPLLRAGEWTGVGRQTVWGKGAYRLARVE